MSENKPRDADLPSFLELWEPLLNEAFVLARANCSSNEDADDAVQEASLRAYRVFARFDHERPFAPWFLQFVRNEARRISGRRVVERERNSQANFSMSDASSRNWELPEARAIETDLADRVRAAVDRLPDKHHDVIILYHFQGLKIAEIAIHLDLSGNTVKTRLRLGRRQLSEILSEHRTSRIEIGAQS